MVLMNTLSSRFQAWSGLVLSTLIVLVSIVSFLTYPSPKSITSLNQSATFNISSVQPVYGRSTWHLDKSVQEYLEVTWDYAGDLTQRSGLWTWNTKQIYLSLVVEWDSPITSASTGKERVKNEAVVWDRIVRRKQDAMGLRLFDQGNKYGVRELTRKWAHIPSARFTLKWNLMPKIGLLAYGNEVTSGEIAIPQRVISQQEAEEGRSHRGKRMPY